MKSAKTKENKRKKIIVYITEIEKYIMMVYLFGILGAFPLYYKEQYFGIGTAKFEFFWNTSLVFLGISLVFVLIKILMKRIEYKKYSEINITNKIRAAFCIDTNKKSDCKSSLKKEEKRNRENGLWNFLDNLSSLDYAVFIYGICVLLSYFFSEFKDYALKGAAGWEMGLCSQMVFIALYFILSRQKNWCFGPKNGVLLPQYKNFAKIILSVHLLSSAFTFIFGILHRFQIDPLGMYEGLNLNQKIEFLSTIGQATWFSSYVCTVFAVGMTLFYVSERRWVRILTGIYSVVSFGILVTQNSDSAFMAIGGIMLILGYYSLSDMKRWQRFWQIMSLMWGTFAGIGILQRIFFHRAIPLDRLSVFFSQSIVTWVMLAVSLTVLLFYKKYDDNDRKEKRSEKKTDTGRIMKTTKKIYQGILLLFAAAVVITIIFIYLNTKGYLLKWFGYQSMNQYLLFDYHWGSNRGSTWIVCWEAFCSLPWFQKLFGVGPDSLSEYLYRVPEISEFLYHLWGNIRLTNAHNEYLNSLLCYGVVGVTVWLSILIGGICYFYKKAKEQPFMIAFALCIAGYACHNIFCYQQICCTPFLFIALGIGESLTKSENFNTIK